MNAAQATAKLMDRFGVPADARGTTPFPRPATALKTNGPAGRKKYVLSHAIVDAVTESVQAHGRKNKVQREVTHREQARARNVKRETHTRQRSMLRGALSQLQPCPKCGGSGKGIHGKNCGPCRGRGRKLRTRENQVVTRPLFGGKRRGPKRAAIHQFLFPQHSGTTFVVYNVRTGQAVKKARYPVTAKVNAEEARRMAEKHAESLNLEAHDSSSGFKTPDRKFEVREAPHNPKRRYYATSPREIADSDHADLFDHDLLFDEDGEEDFAGFAKLQNFVHTDAIPLTWRDKLVVSVYDMCGLFENGRCIARQEKVIARRAGVTAKVVRKTMRKLERIRFIKIRPTGEEVLGPDGATIVHRRSN